MIIARIGVSPSMVMTGNGKATSIAGAILAPAAATTVAAFGFRSSLYGLLPGLAPPLAGLIASPTVISRRICNVPRWGNQTQQERWAGAPSSGGSVVELGIIAALQIVDEAAADCR